MSIKNIIQQENDLQEMSPRSLANYLNNPTGQYNPYLVAGELQRKEAFAQRQMTEVPQGTVVDELVATAAPMGGMPMGGMPMGGMPMPRPEEMVSESITETGISNLPAPNIGQNYADGGIVGYDDGGEVGFFDQARDFDYKGFLNDRLESAVKGLDERFARDAERIRIHKETGEFPPMTEQEMDDAAAFLPGAGLKSVGQQGIKKATPYVKKAADYIKDKFKKKKATTPPATPKKKLTKKEQDAFLKKQKTPPQTALEKANQFKKPSTKGPVTQGIIDAAKFVGPKIGPGIRATGRGIKNYAGELGLAGGVGLGIDALLNEGVLYGETPEEKAQREAKEIYDSPAEVKKRADLVRDIANKAKEQERADALQAKRDAEAKRRAYLALALGGAKTMAGESPFALTNIGAGLGTGVASLVELDEADAARQSAELLADAKMRQNLYEFNLERRLKIAEFRAELSENAEFRAAVDAQLEAIGQDRTTIDHAKLVAIEEKIIMQSYPELGPTAGATMVAGETYAEV